MRITRDCYFSVQFIAEITLSSMVIFTFKFDVEIIFLVFFLFGLLLKFQGAQQVQNLWVLHFIFIAMDCSKQFEQNILHVG